MHPDAETGGGLHAARVPDAHNGKNRGAIARMESAFHTAFPKLTNCVHYATTDFAEHNDILRETTITPAQKTKTVAGEWPLRRAESLPRRRQQRYELRVNNPPCK